MLVDLAPRHRAAKVDLHASRSLHLEERPARPAQGGVAGFAKGEASVNLAPQEGGTKLAYAVKAMIGGKLAQVGSRLIDGVAKKIAGEFFTAFNARVSAAGK